MTRRINCTRLSGCQCLTSEAVSFNFKPMSKNPLAVALGKLAAGVPKTMSPAAINQRKNAALARKIKAKAMRENNPK
jgi:hypothetical protein